MKAKTKVINKSAFIRSFKDGTSAKAIVDAGKAKGIVMSAGYVNTIRYQARKQAKAQGPIETGRYESILAAAAAQIGISKAIRILEELSSLSRDLLAQARP